MGLAGSTSRWQVDYSTYDISFFFFLKNNTFVFSALEGTDLFYDENLFAFVLIRVLFVASVISSDEYIFKAFQRAIL